MPALKLDTEAGTIGAWRADPSDSPRGGLVVVQEIFGLNGHIRSVVDGFAEQGYCAIAPAVFDYVEPGVELEYDAAGIARGRGLAARVGVDRAVQAVDAAAAYLRDQFKHVGVVGYCWGGTIAFLANTRLGLPSVSYYGGHIASYLGESPRAPLMMHFGSHDAHIPPKTVHAIREALPEALIHLYDAGHGFNCEPRSDYNESAAQLALQRSVQFFKTEFAR